MLLQVRGPGRAHSAQQSPPQVRVQIRRARIPVLKLPPGFCLFNHGLGLQLSAQQQCCFGVQLSERQAVMQTCR